VSRFPALFSALQEEKALSTIPTVVVSHGSNIGSADPISKISKEKSGSIALNELEVFVTTFGNHDFDVGLANVEPLLSSWRGQVACANVKVIIIIFFLTSFFLFFF
jgi:2',3'-cyclic-nucleotide 2'-phosphodiesterase (5'-nucleotidase family)